MRQLNAKWKVFSGIAVLLVFTLVPLGAFPSTPPPVFSWAQRAGGSGSDRGKAVGVDTNLNTYVISEVFSASADFGPFTLGAGLALARYDSAGNVGLAR